MSSGPVAGRVGGALVVVVGGTESEIDGIDVVGAAVSGGAVEDVPGCCVVVVGAVVVVVVSLTVVVEVVVVGNVDEVEGMVVVFDVVSPSVQSNS